MKRGVFLAVMTLCLLVFSANSALMAKDKREVTRGMTKEEVTKILGKPRAMSFNEDGDRWEYRKVRMTGLDVNDHYITVDFDLSGRVIRYLTTVGPATGKAPATVEAPLPGTPVCHPVPPMYGFSMSETDFAKLRGMVSRKSFENERYELIEAACLGGWFTCSQCVSMMNLFSFDEEKLKVVSLMAPRVVDPQNSYSVISRFTFDSDKDKAARLFSGK